jgi:hypothetical protein
MRRALASRIDKLEANGKPVVRIPCVLHVRRNESSDEARARFAATYPNAPRGHGLLIVPRRDRTAEDDSDFAITFKAQQLALVAEARTEISLSRCTDTTDRRVRPKHQSRLSPI